MNNSKLALDSIPLKEEGNIDRKPMLREREGVLLKIISALQEVQSSKEWSTLKTEVFDNLVNTLEYGLRDEAKKDNPDSLKLNRLAGQLKWAEKYADLNKLENVFRVELTNIRQKLNEPERPGL